MFRRSCRLGKPIFEKAKDCFVAVIAPSGNMAGNLDVRTEFHNVH